MKTENLEFEIGDTVFLKSDSNRKNAMVVTNIKHITPTDFTDPFSLEIRKPPNYDPWIKIFCTWHNSQRKLENGDFQATILIK